MLNNVSFNLTSTSTRRQFYLLAENALEIFYSRKGLNYNDLIVAIKEVIVI